MKKIIKIIIFSGILVLPALSYFGDYNDSNDNSKYGDHGWIMEQQAQQSLEYEQERLKDQMQMHDLENEEPQTQNFEDQENIIQKIRGTETEDSYDPVCPYGGCV